MRTSARLFSILLLLSLVLPFAGTRLWMEYARGQVREEVKHRLFDGLPDEELVELRFSLADARTELDWEHEREFEWNGQMYDVVRKQEIRDSLVLVCYPDNAESEIKRQLRELTERLWQSDPRQQQQHAQLRHFQKILINQGFETLSLQSPNPGCQPVPESIGLPVQHPFLQPPAPPPKSC